MRALALMLRVCRVAGPSCLQLVAKEAELAKLQQLVDEAAAEQQRLQQRSQALEAAQQQLAKERQAHQAAGEQLEAGRQQLAADQAEVAEGRRQLEGLSQRQAAVASAEQQQRELVRRACIHDHAA
jgi:hypothetical protein